MKLKKNQLWKSMGAGFTSHGNFTWELDKWYHQDGKIKACKNGFHASTRIIDAMQYTNLEVLGLVEVKGKSDKSEKDKQAWSDMRIVKAWKWKKEDSVALAIFAAEQVIDIYEKQYPNDGRPRKAIEAAKKWLAEPTDKNKEEAAWAAWAAAWAAWTARAAARAAAWAATEAAEAAEAARAAARAAAWAATEAAEAARAAWADSKAILNKCEQFIQERIKSLEEIN